MLRVLEHVVSSGVVRVWLEVLGRRFDVVEGVGRTSSRSSMSGRVDLYHVRIYLECFHFLGKTRGFWRLWVHLLSSLKYCFFE